jgi:ADP-ribosyl-[dinitrogen reductase] hydrolase
VKVVNARTSQTHPLQIAVAHTRTGGRIGMTFCPGKCDSKAMTGAWQRDLDLDLRVVADWGASALVTLMESFELELLKVPEIGRATEAMGIDWFHLPIRDVSIPDAEFEAIWVSQGQALRARLEDGQAVVVHCRGGLGRTGLIAARLLIELGEDPRGALETVRAARPGAVETREQEVYVLGLG